MSFVDFVSDLFGENSSLVRKRIARLRGLVGGNAGQPEGHALDFSGRIFLVTTWSKGKGEHDFISILSERGISIAQTFRVNSTRFGDQALIQALRSAEPQLRRGDAVAIVRGGGDLTNPSFRPFSNSQSKSEIERLRRERAVFFVIGLAHSDDHFVVEQAADIFGHTPSDAAYKFAKALETTS